ncbi:MAG TPA: cytochrome c oxidase subunit 3 [bacterium]|jgi:cytochrome c oxidase subunit 3
MAARASTLQERPAPPHGPRGPSGEGGGSGRDGDGVVQPVSPARIAVWLFVGTVTVLFAAFTSTYLARRGGPGWTDVPLPSILWLSTAILAISSGVLEWARRAGRAGDVGGLRRGVTLTTILGIGFLAAQLAAWRQLVAAGLYLSSNAHSSFFYLLTGAHGLHLVGGIAALLYTVRKVYRAHEPGEALAVTDPTATFWHFLGILWVYLFILLFWI